MAGKKQMFIMARRNGGRKSGNQLVILREWEYNNIEELCGAGDLDHKQRQTREDMP